MCLWHVWLCVGAGGLSWLAEMAFVACLCVNQPETQPPLTTAVPLPCTPPPQQTVRTVSVCRVMALSRTAYIALASVFPMSTQMLLDNLMREAQEARSGGFVYQCLLFMHVDICGGGEGAQAQSCWTTSCARPRRRARGALCRL